MKVRNFFRHMNRGIVLGVVLIIGLIVYIMIDNARFSTEKIVIKDMVVAYAKEAEGFMIYPESIIKPKQKVTTADIAKKNKENKVIIDKYFANSGAWSRYNFYQDAISSLESVFDSNNERCAYVTECKFEILNITKLGKIGPNLAAGDVEVKTTIKTIGKPDYFRLFMTAYADEYNGGTEEDSQKGIDTEVNTYSSKVTYDKVKFMKSNGKWKVIEVSGYITENEVYN